MKTLKIMRQSGKSDCGPDTVRDYCYVSRDNAIRILFLKPFPLKETKVCTNEMIACFWDMLQNDPAVQAGGKRLLGKWV